MLPRRGDEIKGIKNITIIAEGVQIEKSTVLAL